MTSLWTWFFGTGATSRKIIHDNKNELQISIGIARQSKKKSEEAVRIAQCALERLQKAKDDGEKS